MYNKGGLYQGILYTTLTNLPKTPLSGDLQIACVLAHTTSYHHTSDTNKNIAMLWRACIVLNLIRSVASECVAQKRDLEDLKRPHNTTISENP